MGSSRRSSKMSTFSKSPKIFITAQVFLLIIKIFSSVCLKRNLVFYIFKRIWMMLALLVWGLLFDMLQCKSVVLKCSSSPQLPGVRSSHCPEFIPFHSIEVQHRTLKCAVNTHCAVKAEVHQEYLHYNYLQFKHKLAFCVLDVHVYSCCSLFYQHTVT